MAALAALVVATSARADDFSASVTRHLTIPPTAESPRNSEGSMVELKDGTILLMYSHFTGALRDASSATIVSRLSKDGGRTWDATPVEVIGKEGTQNVMSVSLLRLKSGKIALFYLIKNSSTDCRPYVRVSPDEGKTWGERTLCIEEVGYYVVNNDRAIQLSTGRILFPSSRHEFQKNAEGKIRLGAGIVSAFYSDDEGKTWQRSKTQVAAPDTSKTGFQEPGVVELKDGKIMLWLRNDMGSQYRALSADKGESWSPAEPSELASPVSPASIKRIPKTGDLMAIWNDHRTIDPALAAKRTPLSVAISKDEGKTWKKSKSIETDPNGVFCYTAILFPDDRVLIAHSGLNQIPYTIESFTVEALYR